MGKFMIVTFLVLGAVFYQMSGGADFEPELRAPRAIAQTDLAPAAPADGGVQVTRADTASLIEIAPPAAAPAPVAEPVVFTPLPAGEVIITPAPDAAPAQVTETAAPVTEQPSLDLRLVAGDWVNMRSGPSTAFDVLDTLPRGTEAEVVEVNADGWARIRVTDTGQEGWMAERLLSDI